MFPILNWDEPLGRPSAPAPSIQYHASNLDWRLISYMILYIFQCHSPKSSHPLPLPPSPKDCSTYQCLFCCLVYRVIVFNNISWAMSLQAGGTKAKINRWNYRKLKSFCIEKDTITKMKSPPNEWEKIFGNNIWWGLNIQNMQIVHTDQYQKAKQPNWKKGRGPK